MTIEEKRDALNEFCGKTKCDKCPLKLKDHWTNYCDEVECLCFDDSPESELDEALQIIEYFKNNSVNHPSHYNKGKIEVVDFIADQKLNFDRGNAIKYVCRAGSKDPDKEIQDLEKAIWYINHEIKILKGDIENGTEKETT